MLKESAKMVLDLLMNLTFLISLTILSDFVESRVPRTSRAGLLLQGLLSFAWSPFQPAGACSRIARSIASANRRRSA